MCKSRRTFAPVAGVLALIALLASCGADRSGGPRGDPTAVVGKAPDLTLAARSARVAVATPSATANGTVDFATGQAAMKVRPPSAAGPELTAPAVAVDVVRAAVSVRSYGGQEVQGASTIKYELDVAPSESLASRLGGGLRRATFYADVFVDSQGRVRRVVIPLDLNERRPSDVHQILAKLVTIDFYDFGTPV